jgi:hypothetical protein
MPRTELLNEQGKATISAAGTATVTLTPNRLETWHLTRIAVSTTTNVLEPVAQVYIGAVSPGNLLSGTYTGSLDSSDENQWLGPALPLICAWSGGDVGAVATLSIFGQKIYS